MTITLAAVYTRHRAARRADRRAAEEFALTLAGAVTISGIVALAAVSPMMARRGRSERGRGGEGLRRLAGPPGADRLRQASALGSTLRARPVIYAAWIVISLLTIPMFVLSPKELAPSEGGAAIFGIINSSANATTRPEELFRPDVGESVLEHAGARIHLSDSFSPSDPTSAALGVDSFSGMVLQPGAGASAPSSRSCRRCRPAVPDPQLSDLRDHPAGPAGRRQFPDRIRDRLDGGRRPAARIRAKGADEGDAERGLQLSAERPEDRPAAVGDRGRSRQGGRWASVGQVGGGMATALGGEYINGSSSRAGLQGDSSC